MANTGRKPDPVDIVVVGAGASGGTAAKALSELGFWFMGLENGPWLRHQTNGGYSHE